MPELRCRRCGSTLEPHTDQTKRCTVCVRFGALSSNAQRARRGGDTPGVDITLTGFAEWFANQPRRCSYCSIPESLLDLLDLKTQVGLPLSRLGVDRPENTKPYTAHNMVLCCFACNKAKSNTFTESEMRFVGEAVAEAWTRRLASRGVSWTYGQPDPR